MRISVASPDDAPRAAALFNAAFDDRVITVAGVRYRQTSAKPEDRIAVSPRGAGQRARRLGVRAACDVFAASATMGYAGIVVHPDHRRRARGQPSGTSCRGTSTRSVCGASSRTAGPTPTRWRSRAAAASPSRRPTPRRPSTRGRSARRRSRLPGSALLRWRTSATTPLRCSRPTARARSTSPGPRISPERPTRAGGA